MSSRKYTDQSLRSLIGEMLKNNGLDKKFNVLEIIRCYHDVVGPVISRKTRDVQIRDRKMIIRLDSGVMKEELSLRKTQLIGLINEKMGQVVVEEIEVW